MDWRHQASTERSFSTENEAVTSITAFGVASRGGAENLRSWQGPSNAYFEGPFACPREQLQEQLQVELGGRLTCRVRTLAQCFRASVSSTDFVHRPVDVSRPDVRIGGKPCATKVENENVIFPLRRPLSRSRHCLFGSHEDEQSGRGNLAAEGLESMRSGSQDVALALQDLLGENEGAASNEVAATGRESQSEEGPACGVRRWGSFPGGCGRRLRRS